MANRDNPSGFFPLDHNPPKGKYTAGGTITKGDAVMPSSGKVVLFVAGAGNKCVGVAAHSAVADQDILVYDDPDTEFVGQCSGTFALTSRLALCDLEGATGAQEVNENATVDSTVRIVRHYTDEPGSAEVGANSRVVFRIIDHAYA